MKTLKKAFFPVSASDIFCKVSGQRSLFEDDMSKFRRIPRFKAVIAEDSGHGFSVVAPNYKMVA